MCRRTARYAPSDFFDLQGIDFDFLLWPVLRVARELRNFFNHVITFNHFTEDAVPVIEPGSGGHRHEKLTSIRVRAGVRHGEKAWFTVLERWMKLIRKLIAGAAPASALRAPALNHKIRNHAVKNE